MATLYAMNAGGNWATAGSWSTVGDKDANRAANPSSAAPTTSDDCILDDYSGNITVNTTSCAAKTLTCTGYTGTLTFTSGQILQCNGNCTFDNTMTLSGTGTLRFGVAAVTLTMDGLTFPGSISFTAFNTTLTLTGNLTITGSLTITSLFTFSGAYNVTCGILYLVSSYDLTLVSGQTYTITDFLLIVNANSIGASIGVKASTASSAVYLNYSGTAANCKIFGRYFTDIDASGSAVALLNWHGGTLTRTENIYNVTAASFPAVADVESGVEYGGVDDASANRLTGTLAAGGGGPSRVLSMSRTLTAAI